jgi:hypothetical protein
MTSDLTTLSTIALEGVTGGGVTAASSDHELMSHAFPLGMLPSDLPRSRKEEIAMIARIRRSISVDALFKAHNRTMTVGQKLFRFVRSL